MKERTMNVAIHDVMQVCRNGHVVTDRLHACPEAGRGHCDRCGAVTFDRCQTCGEELPGAVCIPGLLPIGGRQPPHYCPTCGAAFPWAPRRRLPDSDPRSELENLLRRLPRVVRQLRSRCGDRPPFRVDDERDLEDLLRSLLPLRFDDVRPESRTPRYASCTRTDFLLAPEHLAVTAKYARPPLGEPQLAEQWREDVGYWRGQRNCRTLIGFVYDPEGQLRDPSAHEAAWFIRENAWEARCVVAAC
jgi:hypothetical protein